MSYGPGGYEEDWDDDDGFDFGDYHGDAGEYSAGTKHYYVSSQNNVKENTKLTTTQLRNNDSSVTMGNGKDNGRGRGGRGGFALPNKQQNNNRKNKRNNNNQGNILFGRRTNENAHAKRLFDERNSQLSEDFRAATFNENVQAITTILDQGLPVDHVLKTDWTALMHAANRGSPQILEFLIKRGANVNYHKDMYTVLMAACSSDCNNKENLIQCVNYLIEKGSKIDSHDRYHMTPLMYACRNGQEGIVDILLRNKCDINKQDQRGWDALCWAASRGHGRIVRILLDQNANPMQYTNDGQTAEDLAYDGGFTIIANILNVAANPSQRHVDPNLVQNTVDSDQNAIRYGDLDLFLFGLELGHLVPLFQSHSISFDGFLKLNDAELQQIGIGQIGIRKKILSAIHDVHTKPWDMSSLPTQQHSTNKFTSDDLTLVLANVQKHLFHIQCSVVYASKSLNTSQQPSTIIQDLHHVQQFMDGTKSISDTLNSIASEVSNLECSINKISSHVPCLPADLILDEKPKEKNEKTSRIRYPFLLVSGSLVLGLTFVWFNRDKLR